jgi:hypothetical protein
MCVCMCERVDSYFHSGLIIKNKDSWVFSILIYIYIYIFHKIVNLTTRRRKKNKWAYKKLSILCLLAFNFRHKNNIYNNAK